MLSDWQPCYLALLRDISKLAFMDASKIHLVFWKQIGLRRYIVAPILLLITLSTLESFNSNLLLYLVGAGSIAVWLFALIRLSAVFLFRRQWTFALCYGLIAFLCVPVSYFLLRSGDYVHLAASYPWYRGQIQTDPTHEHSFAWGIYGGSAVSPATTRTLIFAPRDKPKDPLCDMRRLVGRFYILECSDY